SPTLTQDDEVCCLTFETLSSTISIVANVLINSDLWTDIKEFKLPVEITLVLADLDLKELLFRMIHSNYKQPPTAKYALDSHMIREEIRKWKFCFS
ncbi:unnamed protein product, partial [Rotaria magnacalcarata]